MTCIKIDAFRAGVTESEIDGCEREAIRTLTGPDPTRHLVSLSFLHPSPCSIPVGNFMIGNFLPLEDRSSLPLSSSSANGPQLASRAVRVLYPGPLHSPCLGIKQHHIANTEPLPRY